MDKCRVCGNDLKRTIGSTVINTRIEGKRQIVVEDLKFINCTVCSFKELDSKYEDIPRDLLKFYSSMNSVRAKKILDEGTVSYNSIENPEMSKDYGELKEASSGISLSRRLTNWRRAFMKRF